MIGRLSRIGMVSAAVAGAAVLLWIVAAVTVPAATAEAWQIDPSDGVRTVGDVPCGDGTVVYDGWTICTQMPTARSEAAAAAVDGVIYVVGGGEIFSSTATCEAYETATDSWHSIAPLPTARSGLAAAALDGKVYAIGGSTTSFISPTAAVEVYDPFGDTWSSAAPMPAPRGNLAAAALGGKIYVIGGSDGLLSVTSTVMAYDPISDTWEYRAPMPTARSGLAAVAVGGTILAIGGSEGFTATRVVEAYDPGTDSWSIRAQMPVSRSALAAAVVDGIVYVVGGSDSGFFPLSALATNQAYDPVADAWWNAAPMPTARSGLVAVTVDEKLYAIGGSSGIMTSEAANEVYFPAAPHRVFLPLVLKSFAP